MKTRIQFTLALATAIAATLATGCGRKNDTVSQAEKTEKDRPGIAETKAIAEEGFIYGLPIVMFYGAMYENAADHGSEQFKAPFNQIWNDRKTATWQDTTVITPNANTPYSLVFMNLRAEPLVISVPAVEKSRYYVVQLANGNIFNYGYIGTRATGNEPGDYLVVGPDWNGDKPVGIKQMLRSTTQFSLAIFRTQLFCPDDISNVIKVQDAYKVQPLSAYLNQAAPPAAPVEVKLNIACADRRFEFHKRSQLFIRTHNKALTPRCASATNIVRPPESTADTQPQLQPALLRLSAMISQYFRTTN